jgi:uncharacterized protein (DUF1499 family)
MNDAAAVAARLSTIAAPPLVATLAIVAALAVVASGFGARFGAWDYRAAFAILRWGAYAGLGIALFALLLLAIPATRPRGLVALSLAVAVGSVAGVVPLAWMQGARGIPPINDITTDPANPPMFVALLPLRAGATVPATYAGRATADLQRSAYPDIAPIIVADAPNAAFATAMAVARGMGWTIIAADALMGRIEAVATTPWFGFRDDIVVRVSPQGRGSRVDVRSVSRVGRGDLGANAKRVREFSAAMAARSTR